MKLAAINSVSRPYMEALCLVLRTYFYDVITESDGPNWPQEWTDQLFVPDRNFEQRRRARKFLMWVAESGIDTGAWLNAINDNTGDQIPPKSVAGGVGRAYMLGDKVIKFTGDTKEAGRANALVGVDVPNLTKFHAVGEVASFDNGSPDGKRIFAIIMNRVPNKIPGKYRKAASAVYLYINRYDRPISNIGAAVDEIMADDDLLPAKYRDDPDIRVGIIKMLRATDAVYRKTGIMMQDPHSGNVMLRGQDTEFFDMGRTNDWGGAVQGGQIRKIA